MPFEEYRAARSLPGDLLAAIFAQLTPEDRCSCRQQRAVVDLKAHLQAVPPTQAIARSWPTTHHISQMWCTHRAAPHAAGARTGISTQFGDSRRAATAAVCKEWAAVHDDSDSRIWEAVSEDCERAHALKQRGRGTAGCLHRWLSARAPGLRQLSFCDSCSCVEEDTNGEVGNCHTGSCRTSNGTGDLLKLKVRRQPGENSSPLRQGRAAMQAAEPIRGKINPLVAVLADRLMLRNLDTLLLLCCCGVPLGAQANARSS